MKGRDKNPSVQVPDQPEDERPVGTGEEPLTLPNGLAADPYADEMPLGLRRRGVSRFLLAVVVILAVVALALVVFIVGRAILALSTPRPPMPLGWSSPFAAALLTLAVQA